MAHGEPRGIVYRMMCGDSGSDNDMDTLGNAKKQKAATAVDTVMGARI